MKDTAPHRPRRREISSPQSYVLIVAVVSIAAVIASFVVSAEAVTFGSNVLGFCGVLLLYLIACGVVYLFFQPASYSDVAAGIAGAAATDAELRILDEACEYFAGSLNTSDTFRLVADRAAGAVRHQEMRLLVLDRKRDQWIVSQVTGSTMAKGAVVPSEDPLVWECIAERDIVIDRAALTAALPLRRETEVFAVLMLTFADEVEAMAADLSVLDALAGRATPLFLASMALERSQENALTDAVTDLPNERALRLVLENQVAEAMRTAGSRPLAILAIEIKDFTEIGSRYGHAAADRVLTFVAHSLKDSLRQMDFLARGFGDEFLAITPTASIEVTQEIIARIQTSFFGRKIKVSDVDAIELELNFGWASFGADGETPAALLGVARERKERSGSAVAGSVLWFPQETAH